MYPRAGLLKNIRTMERWVELPILKCPRWIWAGNTRVNYFWVSVPMTPQVTTEEMQYPDGLMIEART